MGGVGRVVEEKELNIIYYELLGLELASSRKSISLGIHLDPVAQRYVGKSTDGLTIFYHGKGRETQLYYSLQLASLSTSHLLVYRKH